MSTLPEVPDFHGVTRDALIDYIKEQIRFSRQMTDYCCKLEARIAALEKQATTCVVTIGSGGTSGPYSASGTFVASGGKGGAS